MSDNEKKCTQCCPWTAEEWKKYGASMQKIDDIHNFLQKGALGMSKKAGVSVAAGTAAVLFALAEFIRALSS